MASLSGVVASIPSPSVGELSLGPLNLRLYGLVVALGVIAAAYLAGVLLRHRGLSSELAVHAAVIGVPMGLIGARIYHVITDWKLYRENWVDIFKIWEGGLGIPGAIAGGFLGGLLALRIRKAPMMPVVDAAAAAFPLGQAIGRLGNYFNQELFGRPTDLPWGLEIDPGNRPALYLDEETFHPTFAYEGLWNLAACAVLVWVFRRRFLPSGHMFALYLALYSAGRLWVEALRADPASLILGVRVNIWVMGAVLILSLAFLLTFTRKARKAEQEAADEAAAEDEGEDVGDVGDGESDEPGEPGGDWDDGQAGSDEGEAGDGEAGSDERDMGGDESGSDEGDGDDRGDGKGGDDEGDGKDGDDEGDGKDGESADSAAVGESKEATDAEEGADAAAPAAPEEEEIAPEGDVADASAVAEASLSRSFLRRLRRAGSAEDE